MSNQIYYEIKRGSVVSDCMEETYQFITENSQYFHGVLKPIRDEFADQGTITYISYERNWSFATSVEKSELGRISSGKGAISEGSKCCYDELIETIEG
ncbi:hypothetical protein OAB00_00755 [Akkermansiaceae bacterium]|nr:hypothetical protein [Akkermansiaceae bacterium]